MCYKGGHKRVRLLRIKVSELRYGVLGVEFTAAGVLLQAHAI